MFNFLAFFWAFEVIEIKLNCWSRFEVNCRTDKLNSPHLQVNFSGITEKLTLRRDKPLYKLNNLFQTSLNEISRRLNSIFFIKTSNIVSRFWNHLINLLVSCHLDVTLIHNTLRFFTLLEWIWIEKQKENDEKTYI